MLTCLTPPDWETDGASWPHRKYSEFINAGAYRWHIQRIGAGPQILLIHGTGASTHSWDGLIERLSASFHIIAVDLPGHGFTKAKSWSALTIGHISDQLKQLLTEQSINPEIVVGHSAGAAILYHMIDARVISPAVAVSINGALSPFDGAAGFLFPMMAKALYYNPLFAYGFAQGARDTRRVRRLVQQTGSNVDEGYIQNYAALMKSPGHVSGALNMMAHWDLSQIQHFVAAADCRSRFIVGSNDKAVPPNEAEKISELAKNGDLTVLSGLGHLAHEEDPLTVAKLISGVDS